MTAQAATPREYSDQQLRAAWAACKRPTWPATFEEAMADATHARIVHLHAWLMARPSKAKGAPAASIGTPPPAPRPRFAAPPPGYVDHKRAAAGDRDDD